MDDVPVSRLPIEHAAGCLVPVAVERLEEGEAIGAVPSRDRLEHGRARRNKAQFAALPGQAEVNDALAAVDVADAEPADLPAAEVLVEGRQDRVVALTLAGVGRRSVEAQAGPRRTGGTLG